MLFSCVQISRIGSSLASIRNLNVRAGNAVALPVGSNMATTARRMFVFGSVDL